MSAISCTFLSAGDKGPNSAITSSQFYFLEKYQLFHFSLFGKMLSFYTFGTLATTSGCEVLDDIICEFVYVGMYVCM